MTVAPGATPELTRPTLLSLLDPAFDAINQRTLWWGLAIGVGAVVVALLVTLVVPRSPVAPLVAGAAGVALAIVVATVGSPARVAGGPLVWWMVLTSAIYVAAAFLPTVPRLAVLGVGTLPMLLVARSTALAGREVDAVLTAPSIATTISTFVLALALIETMRQGGAARLFPPVTLATVGVFLCLPETSGSLAAIGFLVPFAIWSVTPWCHSSTWLAPGAAALAPPLMATVIVGLAPNEGRVLFGGIVCLATATVWCAVRLLRRAKPGPPRIAWLFLAVGVGIASIGIARLAVVRTTLDRTMVGSAIGLVALGVWCFAGEVVARRRAS